MPISNQIETPEYIMCDCLELEHRYLEKVHLKLVAVRVKAAKKVLHVFILKIN